MRRALGGEVSLLLASDHMSGLRTPRRHTQGLPLRVLPVSRLPALRMIARTDPYACGPLSFGESQKVGQLTANMRAMEEKNS